MRFSTPFKTTEEINADWENARTSTKICHGLRVVNGGLAVYPENFKNGFGYSVVTGNTFEAKEAIKNAGFKWEPTSKVWYIEGSTEIAFENCVVKYV